MLGGVARLLAVADLTVKTNIRTARRGTLKAPTTSSTKQADHRAWFVCKFPSERSDLRLKCEIRQKLRRSGTHSMFMTH